MKSDSPDPTPQLATPPIGPMLKAASADSRTTNLLLLVMVLCLTGFMPEQFSTVCGSL